MARKTAKSPEAPQEPGFEDRLARLREVVARLESGDTPLEEGVALYREGAALVAACRAQLESARLEVGLVGSGDSGDSGADVVIEPFGQSEPSGGNA